LISPAQLLDPRALGDPRVEGGLARLHDDALLDLAAEALLDLHVAVREALLRPDAQGRGGDAHVCSARA
jgi:hypothetical protein